jgi:Fic family protein
MGLVLHLHRLLFSFTDSFTDVPGGGFKTSENVVVDRLSDGTHVKRFTPVSAAKTPGFVDDLVARCAAAAREDRHHPVLLVGLFALDLLTIHPFLDGNGRITRALTTAL